MAGKKISTIASISKRSHLKFPVIIGRKDLTGFKVNPKLKGIRIPKKWEEIKNIKINKLPESIEKAVAKSPLLVGVGPSAWPRIINNFYFPKFVNLVSNNCQDNEYIRKDGFSVYSIKEQDKYAQITPITPGNIISSRIGKEYLAKLEKPFKFVVYKSMGKFEKICEENGWEFVGNKREIRDKYENKKYFKELLRKLGLRTIPGENYPIGDVKFNLIEDYKRKYNVKTVVLQIAEATWGGGTGTFFIENKDDFDKYRTRTNELFEKLKDTEKKIETVNVAPFITGISSSVPCCATRYGTFVRLDPNSTCRYSRGWSKIANKKWSLFWS